MNSNYNKMKTSRKLFFKFLTVLVFFFKILLSFAENVANIRIINGFDANIKDFSFQISLRYNGVHICGAAVLDSSWAITAAHCVEDYENLPNVFSLRIGSTMRSSGGKIVLISETYKHPSYQTSTMNFDVALLYSKSNELYGINVSPIHLPTIRKKLADNSLAIVSGWGHIDYHTLNLSRNLKYTSVAIISQKECNEKLKHHGGISNEMLCAAARDTDACQGDSGGPLQINATIYGIVSWGIGCADLHYPGVYTRTEIATIRLWIKLLTKL